MAERTIAGRYHLEQPLGGGAMASVWLAQDDTLDRQVAVKLLAPDADRARFEREARAVAALAHPNICRVYDYGETEGGPYMVLEYLSGGTLEERLRGRAPLPDEDTARIARQLAAGLAHAHARGLVHRDLKPANVLFDGEGNAKIADFGIARMAGGRSLTVAGTVLGTAATIAPEQAAGLPATPASDVYSFGVILFRLLTGRPPFASSSAVELVRMHQEEQAPSVASLRPDAPLALAALADGALEKDPARRPRDGGALAAALAGTEDETQVAATAVTQLVAPAPDAAATRVLQPPPPAATRRGRRLPVALAAVAVAVLLGGAALAVVATRSDDPAAPAADTPLSLSTVAPLTTAAEPTSEPATTEAPVEATTDEQTTASATTAGSTTAAVTTAPVTTAPATTAPATTVPSSTSTTVPGTTTAPTETLPPALTTVPTVVPTDTITLPVTQ